MVAALIVRGWLLSVIVGNLETRISQRVKRTLGLHLDFTIGMMWQLFCLCRKTLYVMSWRVGGKVKVVNVNSQGASGGGWQETQTCYAATTRSNTTCLFSRHKSQNKASLSRSWYRDHSQTYNSQFSTWVVYKGFHSISIGNCFTAHLPYYRRCRHCTVLTKAIATRVNANRGWVSSLPTWILA